MEPYSFSIGGGGVMRFLSIAVLGAFLTLYAPHSSVQAHGGGLAADGCHNDRKNGGRHCHRGNPAALVTQTPSGRIYYPICAAARAAGAAPVRRGQPGYGTHLDRDADGVGCE